MNEELDDIIVSFGQLQEEINYKQAQDSLKNLVDNLDLTPQEKAGLETEIAHLSIMLGKLEQSIVQIAVFGMVGRGKSSVLNALLGQNLFAVGPIHGVTRSVESANWFIPTDSEEDIWQDKGVKRIALRGLGNSQIQLIDTPGIDEVEGEEREELARQLARQADLILFVIAGDITQVEYDALSFLREFGKPIILVFNKIDQYPEVDRLAIYHKIRDERVKELLSEEEIVMVAASPLEARAMRLPDGRTKVERYRANPQIDELKLKILDILQREGKSLVALNTMLCADDVNSRLVQRKMLIREAAANKLIEKGTMTKAVAIALNPVTALDLFSGAVIDLALILALSRLYGIEMTMPAALALLQKIAISLGGITASEMIASLGLSSIKGLLGLSAPATVGVSLIPYLSIALTQGSVAGVSTYAIGQITKTYLANGASWGDDGPKAVVSRILSSLDETSILHRIKGELRRKLGRNSPADSKSSTYLGQI